MSLYPRSGKLKGFLKARDLEGPALGTIEKVVLVNLQGEQKPVVKFREPELGDLVLNITNARSLERIAGTDDPEAMVGMQIVLFTQDTEFQGRPTKGIRIGPRRVRSGRCGRLPPARKTRTCRSEEGRAAPGARPDCHPGEPHSGDTMISTAFIPAQAPAGQPRWACFDLVARPGRDKFTKLPKIPGTEARARSNDPRTWRSWSEAHAAVDQHRAHGVLLALVPDDDLFALDLDDVLDERHRIVDPVAQELCAVLDSYTEITPSERGLRILARGPASRAGKHPRTLYTDRQFVSVTGCGFPGSDYEIRMITPAMLDRVYRLIGAPRPSVRDAQGGPVRRPTKIVQLPAPVLEAMGRDRVFRWLVTADDDLHAMSFGLDRPDPSQSDWRLALRGYELGLDPDTVARVIGWRRRQQGTTEGKSPGYAAHAATKAWAHKHGRARLRLVPPAPEPTRTTAYLAAQQALETARQRLNAAADRNWQRIGQRPEIQRLRKKVTNAGWNLISEQSLTG